MQMQAIETIPDRRSHIRCNASSCNHSRLLLLQGKEPWNKGQQLHQQTCEKMSAAKQGHTVPRSVCAKMSRSHAGLRPSQVCTNNSASSILVSGLDLRWLMGLWAYSMCKAAGQMHVVRQEAMCCRVSHVRIRNSVRNIEKTFTKQHYTV